MVDVTARVAMMRERLNAGRAQSENLKLRIAATQPSQEFTTPDFSSERLDRVLSSLFKTEAGKVLAEASDAQAASPVVPIGLPMAKPKEKSPAV